MTYTCNCGQQVGDCGKVAQPSTSSRAEFRPDIQGLRGLAVLLVVVYHAAAGWVPGGFVGVDIFFVISGFLITGILSREFAATGRIDLWRFFARRAKRLLPAALLVVVATLGVSSVIYAPLEQGEIFSAARAAALYLSNFWFAARAVDYFGGESASNPLLHMWSLAVEEQFYVVWPLLLLISFRLGARHRAQAVVLGAVLALSVVSFVFCVWLTHRSQPWAFFGTAARAWEFGLGAAVHLAGGRIGRLPPALLQGLGLAGLAAMLAGAALLSHDTLFPGAYALLPAAGCALTLAALRGSNTTPLRSLLSMSPLARAGDISYSLYLWHWPVLVFAGVLFPQGGGLATLGALGIALALAVLSYRFVENPIRFTDRLQGKRALLLGILLSLAVAALATVGARRVSVESLSGAQSRYLQGMQDGLKGEPWKCQADFDAVDLPQCSFGKRDSPVHVVLFGDSHAGHWFPAFERLAEQHDWRLTLLVKASCPSIDVQVTNYVKRRPYVECDAWRQRMLERIVKEAPALVVIANSRNYPLDADLWAEGAKRTLHALSAAGISALIIRDTPWPGFHVPRCLARLNWQGRDEFEGCAFPTAEALRAGVGFFEAERRISSDFESASFLDLTDAICPTAMCSTVDAGVVKFRDSNHLTVAFATALAPLIENRLRNSPPGKQGSRSLVDRAN